MKVNGTASFVRMMKLRSRSSASWLVQLTANRRGGRFPDAAKIVSGEVTCDGTRAYGRDENAHSSPGVSPMMLERSRPSTSGKRIKCGRRGAGGWLSSRADGT